MNFTPKLKPTLPFKKQEKQMAAAGPTCRHLLRIKLLLLAARLLEDAGGHLGGHKALPILALIVLAAASPLVCPRLRLHSVAHTGTAQL